MRSIILIIDTLRTVTKNINVQEIADPAQQQDLFLKYAPVASPIIVILTFLFNNWYNVTTKRKESQRNWYFKASFEPNIKEVESFFKSASELMKTAQDQYKNSKRWSQNRKIEFIAGTLTQLADLKRIFSIQILTLIKSLYPKEFSEIETILNDFEDACSESFDEGYSKDAYYAFLSRITDIKARLINVLSAPALA